MRPERVFGIAFTFANILNALAFIGHCAKIVADYAPFVTIQLKGTRVDVEFDVEAMGKDVAEALSAQLHAVAATFD